MTKYYARIRIVKEFRVEFPDELFYGESIKNIQNYCSAFRGLNVDELKHEIIDAYSLSGPGYYEQFGCTIGPSRYSREGFPHVLVWWDEDCEIEDSYLEEY